MNEGFLDSLKQWGCDTEGAMERMLDDSEFFMQCLDDYCSSNMLIQLKSYIDGKNIKEGDDMAHSIKGLAANLGLNDISDMSRDIMHHIRAGDFNSADAIFAKMQIRQSELEDIIAKYK